MRIIAGSRKSLRLVVPKGMDTRPTMDRTKETLFNIISPDICGCRFLDLFSGSASIGLEALSRGAKYAVLVEKNKEAVCCIKENIKTTKFESQVRLMNIDILKAINLLEEEQDRFDIIFMDPPFDKGLEKSILLKLLTSNILDDNTIIIVEASILTDFGFMKDTRFSIIKEKLYKTHKHVFINVS